MKFDLELLEFVECNIDPNKLAISGSDKDLSWSELKEEVDKQKEKLLSYNLPEGHPIIIYGHKEIEFIVSIVACMSLKLPYTPVDNVFPEARAKKIQSILKAALIINTTTNSFDYSKEYCHTAYYHEHDHIVYIMFTSGSTGEPKGVQITHSSIIDYTMWIKRDFPFSSDDTFFNQIPFSFDLSTYEVFSFLMYGATIVTFSRESISDSQVFTNRLQAYSCTVWNSTPSFLSISMMAENFNSKFLPALSKFFLAGEQMPHKVANKLFNLFDDVHLYNTYGPTEVTNTSTFIEVTKEILEKYKLIPVGYPKYSTEIRLLDTEDTEGKLIGEIQLIGKNVSIGYFNNDKLNKEKFSIVNGKKAFHTGDYGYFEDSMLFFSGRRDDLVKLHGFRVETTEIDALIIQLTLANDAITIPLKRGTEIIRLVTFVLSDIRIDQKSIKKTIGEKLPYYMVPSDIVQLDNFPYNTNHKIDKKELINIYKNL